MAGFWLNPTTGKCIRVEPTHDAWIRDRNHAEEIGLPEAAYTAIMQLPETAVDEIRIAAMAWGLVRIREHPKYTSIQFRAHPHRVTPILRAVVAALTEIKLHPDTTLVIDNLLLNDSATIGLREFAEKVARDEWVLRDQNDVIPDVPMEKWLKLNRRSANGRYGI